MDENIPVYTSAALGWRVWTVHQGQLMSIGRGSTVWRPGTNIAYCRLQAHYAPHNDCECGLYAFSTLDRARSEAKVYKNVDIPAVWGAVASRGNICLHRDGFRAEESVILALCGEGIDAEWQSQLHREYEVGIYSPNDIEGFATQHAISPPKHEQENLSRDIMIPARAAAVNDASILRTISWGALGFSAAAFLMLLLVNLVIPSCTPGTMCTPKNFPPGVSAVLIVVGVLLVSLFAINIPRKQWRWPIASWFTAIGLGSLFACVLLVSSEFLLLWSIPFLFFAVGLFFKTKGEQTLMIRCGGLVTVMAMGQFASILLATPFLTTPISISKAKPTALSSSESPRPTTSKFHQPSSLARTEVNASLQVQSTLVLSTPQWYKLAGEPTRSEIVWQKCFSLQSSSCSDVQRWTYDKNDMSTEGALSFRIPSNMAGWRARVKIPRRVGVAYSKMTQTIKE